MQDQLEKIIELIQPIFKRMKIYLVDIELRGNQNSRVLSIFADTEAGINMQQITDLSREIEEILDIEDPIKGRYRLDVSSPGVNRPITETWQFRKNLDRMLQVFFRDDDTTKEQIGILKRIDKKEITLQQKEQEITIPLANIIKAVVKLKW